MEYYLPPKSEALAMEGRTNPCSGNLAAIPLANTPARLTKYYTS